MHTSKWAKEGWIYLHAVTLHYPDNPSEEDKKRMKAFFENLEMPCNMCMTNYIKDIKKYPLSDDVLSSKKNLVKWFILIHNETNKNINKPEFTNAQIITFFKEQYGEDISSFFKNDTLKKIKKPVKIKMKLGFHYLGTPNSTITNPFMIKKGSKIINKDQGCACNKH